MSRFQVLAALTAVLAWSGAAAAGPMLTGTATYDPSTRLYTYQYTLDDRSAPAPVDVVFVRVGTHVYDLTHLNPVGYTAPAAFGDFQLASAADVHGDEAVFASGTVYTWHAGSAGPGAGTPPAPGVYAGFSFTSRYAPGTGGDANYELFAVGTRYDAAHEYDARVEVGRVVAPELAPAPEPGTLGLVVAGLAGTGLRGLRRRGRVGRPT
jgi:hypothetical protein